MSSLKIGIVEDDMLIAESIVIALENIGYIPSEPASNFADAQKMIKSELPDLLLLDVMLGEGKDGIEVAEWVNKEIGIPFIFLTGNSDKATIERAKKVNPAAYLVKPFDEEGLYSSIEIAFNSFNLGKESKTQTPKPTVRNFVFVKKGEIFFKVESKEILFLVTDNVYITITTSDKQYLVRSKLQDFIDGFPHDTFIQTHRSYAININHLQAIDTDNLIVGGIEIPIQKAYRQELLEKFQSYK